MKKAIISLFAVALLGSSVHADVAAPVSSSSKDLDKVVDEVNFVETAQKGITLSGYVDAGYDYNFIGAGTTLQNRNGSDRAPKGDFDLHAVKIALEKALPEENKLAAGFRVDLMYGEDVSSIGGTNDAGGAESDDFFLQQAYVNLRLPYGNGVDVKVGKFVTILGYEVMERPSNLNVSYGQLFQNTLPLWHTGVLASYAFSDIVDAKFGIVNGAQSDNNAGLDGSEDGVALTGAVNVKNPGGNANIQTGFYYAPQGDTNLIAAPATGAQENENLLILNQFGNWAPKFADGKLLLGYDAVFGFATEASGAGVAADDSTTWVGAALYTKYQFTDVFSLAGRADYVHNDDNQQYAVNTVSSADIYSLTATAGFDLLENLLLRAEYRADFGDIRPSTTSTDGTSDAHTVSLEVVYSF